MGIDAPGFFPDAFVGDEDASGGEDAASAEDASGPADDAATSLADSGPQSDAGAGATCGGRGGTPCPAGTFCNFPPSSICGRADGPGTCTPIPLRCPITGDAVCGCDGTTYTNACLAARASVSVESTGPCPTRCDPDLVVCASPRPRCLLGQVPSVVAGCWGPCVPIEECTCTTVDDCPMIPGVSDICLRGGICGSRL
jgi:hypothetical protein